MTLIEWFAVACIVGIIALGFKVWLEDTEQNMPWDDEQ